MNTPRISTEGLLPHRYPMHLINEVLEFAGSPVSGRVSCLLQKDAPYFRKQEFEEHWLIEISAQASAAVYLLAKQGLYPAPPRGYLISVREFAYRHKKPLQAGDLLVVDVFFEVEAAPLGQSRCRIFLGHEVVAEMEMAFLLETEG